MTWQHIHCDFPEPPPPKFETVEALAMAVLDHILNAEHAIKQARSNKWGLAASMRYLTEIKQLCAAQVLEQLEVQLQHEPGQAPMQPGQPAPGQPAGAQQPQGGQQQ